MEKLTNEQAFVATCWSKVLFMDYDIFWKMAQECLEETIINHEFANPEIWERLKDKTREDFKILVSSQIIEDGA